MRNLNEEMKKRERGIIIFCIFAEDMAYKKYTNEAVALLSRLISTPSVSRDEQAATDILQKQIKEWGLPCKRSGNNLIVAQRLSKKKPTLLLNAHIDTVKPVASWTRDPFTPTIEDGKLFGLGANDCGGGLVSLLQAYRILSEKKSIPYNLVYVASCEEEVSGQNGFSAVLPYLPPIDVAIVGEPTGMQPAIAEKGLMVIDGVAHGISGHAARNEGVNAINEALDDLQWLRAYQFRKVSPLLGETKATVTVIHGGTQHNVIPDKVEFVIDVRTNEYYQNEYLFAFLQKHMKSELKARSFRLHSSSIPEDHPLVKKCKRMRMKPFGSPTLSDQALMPFPSFKLGPGESSRSHSADEFVKIEEIHQAINTYVKLISE